MPSHPFAPQGCHGIRDSRSESPGEAAGRRNPVWVIAVPIRSARWFAGRIGLVLSVAIKASRGTAAPAAVATARSRGSHDRWLAGRPSMDFGSRPLSAPAIRRSPSNVALDFGPDDWENARSNGWKAF